MEVWTSDPVSMTQNTNMVRELLVSQFLKDKLIDEATAQEMLKYVVVVEKQNWFGKTLNKILGLQNKEDIKCVLMKIVEKENILGSEKKENNT